MRGLLDIIATDSNTWVDDLGRRRAIRATRPRWDANRKVVLPSPFHRAAVQDIGRAVGCVACGAVVPYKTGGSKRPWPVIHWPHVAREKVIRALQAGQRPPPQVLVPMCWSCSMRTARPDNVPPRGPRTGSVQAPAIELDAGRGDVWAELSAVNGAPVVVELPPTEIKRAPRPPGRPRVRDPHRPFAHYKGFDGRRTRPRCARRGCSRRLLRDQRMCCSPDCERQVLEQSRALLERVARAEAKLNACEPNNLKAVSPED